MAHITYETKGTCSRQIDIEVNEAGIIENVKFTNAYIAGFNHTKIWSNANKLIKCYRYLKFKHIKSLAFIYG